MLNLNKDCPISHLKCAFSNSWVELQDQLIKKYHAISHSYIIVMEVSEIFLSYFLNDSAGSAELVSSLCSFCYQIIRNQKSTSRTRLFQRLCLNSDLLARMWSSVINLTMSRSFG